MEVRTGHGYDVHAFGEGDHVAICGVKVPHTHGVLAHSDGDVGLHALTDAILGALAQGDIGQHFPPSDPCWRGADSLTFLRYARSLADTAGFRVTHADVTIVCEAPKVGAHAPAMRATIAQALGTTPDRISVKATTSEKLGFTGRREGIAALATATLVSP
jgi:2-C-methyl-D-erythritol 2,4-cyclodiphosphate synthase